MFDAYTESSFRMQVDGPLMPVSSFMNQMMPWQNRYKQNWMAMIWWGVYLSKNANNIYRNKSDKIGLMNSKEIFKESKN